MKVKLDTNNDARLALVADAELTNIHYVPIEEAAQFPEKKLSIVHLQQAHYCARIVTQGLMIVMEHAMLPGWEKYDEQIKLLRAMGFKHYGEN